MSAHVGGLRRRMAEGTVLTSWSGIPEPLVVELLAALPPEAVTLDMQHGGHDEASVLRSLPMITNRGRHALVRIPVGRFDMASRALDFGAEAVIAPMVDSVGDAKAFAAAMKYPPLGERSWGPTFAAPRSGRPSDPQAWLANANTDTLAIAMIETRRALDALDDILVVPGIDAVLVGPSDFSIAWTNGERVDPALPEMTETVADIAARAKAAGKFAAIFAADPSLCGRYEEMGFSLIACATEQSLFRAGMQATMALVRGETKS